MGRGDGSQNEIHNSTTAPTAGAAAPAEKRSEEKERLDETAQSRAGDLRSRRGEFSGARSELRCVIDPYCRMMGSRPRSQSSCARKVPRSTRKPAMPTTQWIERPDHTRITTRQTRRRAFHSHLSRSRWARPQSRARKSFRCLGTGLPSAQVLNGHRTLPKAWHVDQSFT